MSEENRTVAADSTNPTVEKAPEPEPYMTLETMLKNYVHFGNPVTIHLMRGTHCCAPQEQIDCDPDVSFKPNWEYDKVIPKEFLTARIIAWTVNKDYSISVAVNIWRPEPEFEEELPF